jgi:hypothetical protein
LRFYASHICGVRLAATDVVGIKELGWQDVQQFRLADRAWLRRSLFNFFTSSRKPVILGLDPSQFVAEGLVFFYQILVPSVIVFRLRPSHPDYGNRSGSKCPEISFRWSSSHDPTCPALPGIRYGGSLGESDGASKDFAVEETLKGRAEYQAASGKACVNCFSAAFECVLVTTLWSGCRAALCRATLSSAATLAIATHIWSMVVYLS